MKEGKYAIFGQFPRLVPIPNRGGTGTSTGEVLVPLLPTALISCVSTLLSPNSCTDSIGTLVNDLREFK